MAVSGKQKSTTEKKVEDVVAQNNVQEQVKPEPIKENVPYIDPDLSIEIRPIPNRDGIEEYSKELAHFASPKTITAYPNPVSLRYETGLGVEDIAYLKSIGFPYDFEDTQYVPRQAHKFWESSMVKTELKCTPQFLYPGRNVFDFIKWKYLLVSNYIYKNEAEMQFGGKTEATHYIYDEKVENSVKALKIEKRNNIINELKEVTLQRKRNFILIIENEDVSTKDDNYVTLKLDEIISDTNKCKQLESLLKTNDEEINLKALVKSAILKNVLKKTPKGYFYLDTNLGFSEDIVLKNLNTTDNQSILISIMNKIK